MEKLKKEKTNIPKNNSFVFNEDELYVASDDEPTFGNISWAEMVNTELKASLGDEIALSSSIGETVLDKKKTNKIDVSDILKSDKGDLDDLKILKYQKEIIEDIKKSIIKYMNSDTKTGLKFDYDQLVTKLSWIVDTSKILSKKLKLELYTHKTIKNTVPRSSYKFCNRRHECHYNYLHKEYDGCYAQHYVHNMVNADLSALLDYIENTPNDKIKTNEIKTTIKTMSFVINHMVDELQNIYNIYDGDMDKYHQERTPETTYKKSKRKYKKTKKVTL
jgi:hypothetical protein